MSGTVMLSKGVVVADLVNCVESSAPVADNSRWTLGEPDLVVSTPWVTVKADPLDYWVGLPPSSTGLSEDRWVKSVEIREENDLHNTGGENISVRDVFRQMLWTTAVPGQESSSSDAGERSGTWPVYQAGHDTYVFPDGAGKLLKAASNVIFASAHLHANGKETKARLLYGFKFFPKDFKPGYKRA
jgi:hypothetical protein